MDQQIYDPTADFPFNELTFVSPVPMAGGSHFIRCFANSQQKPLYIQPPKCKLKSGIIKAGKRMYCDLVFCHDDETFIEWIDSYETACQDRIYDSREKWFESSLEKHDIENSFSQTMKLYKSGKLYTMRVNIPVRLGKCGLKIFNEDEQDVSPESIKEDTYVATILEIQGIKCSSRNFQVEVEVKQMMVLKPMDLFDKCIFGKSSAATSVATSSAGPISVQKQSYAETEEPLYNSLTAPVPAPTPVQTPMNPVQPIQMKSASLSSSSSSTDQESMVESVKESSLGTNASSSEKMVEAEESSNQDELCEVDIPLDNFTSTGENDVVKLKDRNEVYYEMYREAKRKAKIARDFALASYLEAKRIQNTYGLELDDDDDTEKEQQDVEDLEEHLDALP